MTAAAAYVRPAVVAAGAAAVTAGESQDACCWVFNGWWGMEWVCMIGVEALAV